jgi:hypothetical protein
VRPWLQSLTPKKEEEKGEGKREGEGGRRREERERERISKPMIGLAPKTGEGPAMKPGRMVGANPTSLMCLHVNLLITILKVFANLMPII